MHKKIREQGYSLVEILVATVLFTVVAGAILMSSQTGVKSSITTTKVVEQTAAARNAMTILSDVISQSKMSLVSTRPCPDNSDCKSGSMEILVKVPVKTPDPVQDTIYTPDGSVKFGAAGRTDCFYRYRVTPSNQLVKRVECNEEHFCGDGICDADESVDGQDGTQVCLPDCHGTIGDGICNSYGGETVINSVDCQNANDGICTPGESCGVPSGNNDCCTTIIPNNGVCSPGEQCGVPTGNNDCCSGGGGGGCFLAGTPITMADGTFKAIEHIKEGDVIMAFDETSKTFKPDKVTKLFQHTQNGYLLINGHLKVTPNHPFMTDSKSNITPSQISSEGLRWARIGSLQIGDRILNGKGDWETINHIEKFNGKIHTYNFEINPYHTYIAGGYVVHNRMMKDDGGSLNQN